MAVIVCWKKLLFMVLFGNFFSSTDCQMEAFKELQQIDKEIATSFALLLDVAKQQNAGVDEIQKGLVNKVALEGSILEGSMTAAVFKPLKTKDGINRELKTGFTFNVMEIPENYKHLVEDIRVKEGFVKVRADMDTLRFLETLELKVDPKEYAEILPHVVQNGYLKPYRLKEKVLLKLEEKIEEFASYDGVAELFLAAALDKEFSSIELSRSLHKLSKLPSSSYVNLIVDKKLKLKVSWDVGAVIKLNWWPQVAQEWIDRKREWPSKDTVTSLSRSSYITTKPSDEHKLNKDSLELRYSFSHIESVLVGEWSSQQALVYLTFKSMLYRWIKPIISDRIHSLIAKNVMLWSCEEHPPNHPIWSDTSVIPALSVLFSKLVEAMESKTLPNYFVRKINILENINEEVRVREIKQIKRILTDVNKYIPDNAKEISEACREMLGLIQKCHKVLNDIANENYDIFLQRPDLIPKALEIFGLNFLNFGGKKKEEIHKTMGDVKDTLSKKWNEFQEELNVEDVQKKVQDKVKEVADNFDLNDIEKKAKEWLKKWEL